MSFFPTFQEMANQEIFNNTADKRNRLGSIGFSNDGRFYRYGNVGTSNIVAAALTQTEVPSANSDELAVAAAVAANSRTVTVTVNLTDNDCAEGYLNIEDDTGEGHLYNIESHTDDGTTATVILEGGHGVLVALTTSTTVGMWQNPWKDVIIHPSPPTAMLTGVTPRAHNAARWGWFQVGGLASVITEGTLVIGKSCVPSTTADGAVAPPALTEATPNTGFDQPLVGTVHEVAVTTEESTIWLRGLGI